MFGRSSLRLCYIIMSEDGRIWLENGEWGRPEANDMGEAKIFLSRKRAELARSERNCPASIYEIGLHNGRPVMLIDAYDYWLDAKYRGAGRS
jgi:hypothetical protein